VRNPEGEERVEPRVMAVLLALAKRDGDVVSQDQLIEEVWEGRIFDNQPIQRCIALLRKHFQDEKPFEYVENLPRRGYRLMKSVQLHPEILAEGDEPGMPPRSDLRWKVIAAVILAGFVAVSMYTCRDTFRPPAVNSLAIVPLTNYTGDPTRQYIVDGIRDILAQRLTELDALTVKNIRMPVDGDWEKSAREFDVESFLTGSVHEQDGALKVIYEIVDGRDGVIIDSGEVNGHVDDLFAIQERLANAVRDALAGGDTPELITRPAPNRIAHRIFMRGMHALEYRGEGSNLEYSIGFFEESIDLDETYGAPYLGLATALALLPDYRGEDVAIYHRRAIETIEAGVAQDESIRDAGGAIFGFVYHQQKRWQASEEHYRRAVNAAVVDSNAFSWYSRMLASVGRLEEALEMAQRAEVIDPNGNIVNSRIAMVYTWLGSNEMASYYFQRANEFKATGILHVMAQTLLLVREGKLDEARNLAYAAAAMQEAPAYWIEPVFRAFGDRNHREEGLAAINRAWEEQIVIPGIAFMGRVMLGDVDGAMDIARLLEGPGEVFATELLFLPETAALRRHPEFMPLLERLRIVEHWNQVGCTWDGDALQCDREAGSP
jgi:TolB-like protein